MANQLTTGLLPTNRFFSVIIPTLNEEKFLPKLLNNLEKQTDKDFEVIIVDTLSKDKTEQVAKSFIKLPLRFFSRQAPNVAAQRNFGAEVAVGQYLIFLDADTTVNPSFIKRLKAVIKKEKGLIFIPRVDPKEKHQFPEMQLVYPLINLLVEISQNFGKPLSAGGNMIWEKHFFKLVGGFDEKLDITEDHDIIRKAHRWGVKVKMIHSVKINFSLRRMKREGRLRLFYKILISHLHLAFNERLTKKMFTYEMGGHLYKGSNHSKRRTKFDYQEVSKKLRQLFTRLLKEI